MQKKYWRWYIMVQYEAGYPLAKEEAHEVAMVHADPCNVDAARSHSRRQIPHPFERVALIESAIDDRSRRRAFPLPGRRADGHVGPARCGGPIGTGYGCCSGRRKLGAGFLALVVFVLAFAVPGECATPSANSWSLHPELTIGGDDVPENEVIYWVGGFDVDSDGSIYVADYKSEVVLRFGADGRLIARIGSRGEGPGDIRQPGALAIERRGVFVLFDRGNRRLERLDSLGTFLGARRFSDSILGLCRQASGGFIARVHRRPVGPPADPSVYAVVLFSDSLREASVLDRFESRDNVVVGSASSYAATDAPFAPALLCETLPDDHVVVIHSNERIFRILSSGGRVVRTIELPGDPLPVTSADRKRYFGRFVRNGKSVLGAELRNAIEFPANLPNATGLFVDEEGRIWIRRSGTGGRPGPFDVFSSHGDYLERVSLPGLPDQNVVARHGRWYALYGFSRDELPRIVRYRVERLSTE